MNKKALIEPYNGRQFIPPELIGARCQYRVTNNSGRRSEPAR